MFINIIGTLGNLGFAYACLPTAWKTFKAGKSIGVPVSLAWNIWVSCLLFYSYTFLSYTDDILVWIGGMVEISSYTVVLWYHYLPRRTK